MTIDELVEQVARELAGRTTNSFWADEHWPEYVKDARAALRAAVGPIMEMAAKNCDYAADKYRELSDRWLAKGTLGVNASIDTARTLGEATRALAAEMQEKLR